MKSIKMELPGVGPILLERSLKAKTIRITVKPQKGARVAVPVGASFAEAKAFARSKAGWIKKHLENMARMEALRAKLPKPPPIRRAAARRMLLQRLELLAARHGFTYNTVYVRNQKTRWGSCSARNNISLNVNLVRLPQNLIDYVILHELMHTRIRDHSPAFWEQLNRLIAPARQLDRQLRAYELMLG